MIGGEYKPPRVPVGDKPYPLTLGAPESLRGG